LLHGGILQAVVAERARRAPPIFTQAPQDVAEHAPRSSLRRCLHAAMVTAGLCGHKLTRHDVRQLSASCGCTLQGVHVPFVMLEDLMMQRNKYLDRRKTIKRDPDVRALLRSFWSVTKGIQSQQARYVDLHLAIAKALYQYFDESETRHNLVCEWTKMTDNGKKAMPYRLFAAPLFCLADVWTFSARSSVYAHFLATVLSAISVVRHSEEDGSVAWSSLNDICPHSAETSLAEDSVRLKPLSEICYMEVFCKQLWQRAQELGDEDSDVEILEELVLEPSSTDCDILQPAAPVQRTKMRPIHRRNKLLTARPRKSLLVAKMISLEQAMNGTQPTTAASVDTLHIQTRPPRTRFRELPACANVPPLGRLATPKWKSPTLEDPPIFRGDGRLQFTFGRKCLDDYRIRRRRPYDTGSQTERHSTREESRAFKLELIKQRRSKIFSSEASNFCSKHIATQTNDRDANPLSTTGGKTMGSTGGGSTDKRGGGNTGGSTDRRGGGTRGGSTDRRGGTYRRGGEAIGGSTRGKRESKIRALSLPSASTQTT